MSTVPQFTKDHTLFSLTLLGPFRTSLGDGVELEFRTQKEQALLAYLAVEARHSHRREALAEFFWSGRSEGVALTSLRQALTGLRRVIGGAYLLTTRYTVQFNAASDHWLDVTVYRAHFETIRSHTHDDPVTCPICMGHRQQAVVLYRDHFLAGLVLNESQEFQEWVTFHRERLFRQQVETLQQLAHYRRKLGDLERAHRYARSWVELAPLSERAHRLVMEMLVANGQRREALNQYETCRRVLGKEIGMEPGPETAALYKRIRNGRGFTQIPYPYASTSHNLPVQLTPFFGRQGELAHIDQLLSVPECRLLTVIGPGGVGKTRLALRAAEGVHGADTFADGVWFVPLDAIPSPNLLAVSVIHALNMSLEDQQNPKTQLLNYLKPRTMLLVMDNFEHLLTPPSRSPAGIGRQSQDEREGTDLLLEILREAPGVKILVTSRVRLNCQAEFLLCLEGLPHPDVQSAISDFGLDEVVQSFSAVQLFMERARRVRVGIDATEESIPSVVRICQLVEGLPLGIELAAAGLEQHSCAQVAQAIQENLDTLTVSLRDLPRRQQSLRATFKHSWDLLPQAERGLFRRLSVFRGGFVVQAARHVAGADPSGLDSLLDKSLLKVSSLNYTQNAPVRRFDLHLTLREYAAEKLAENSQEEATTRAQHSRFYLTFLREREETLISERGKEALDQIQGESTNVRVAWEWAVSQSQAAILLQSAPTLSRFYIRTGLFQEGEAVFGRAAECIRDMGPGTTLPGEVTRRKAKTRPFTPDECTRTCLLARLRVEQAHFLIELRKYALALEHAQVAIILAAACQSYSIEAMGNLVCGYAHHYQSKWILAGEFYEQALSLAQEGLNSIPQLHGVDSHASLCEMEARSFNDLAAVCNRLGNYDDAERYLEQSLRAARDMDDQGGQSRALNSLGTVMMKQGDFSKALTYYHEALCGAQACGDRRLEGPILTNLGVAFFHLGSYEQARAYYENALQIQQESGTRQKEIASLFNLGLVHHLVGDNQAALSRIQKALHIAQDVGDRRAQAFAWMGLGHVFLGLGALENAHEAYQESISLRRELKQEYLMTEPLAGLARVALAVGKINQALEHVEGILRLARDCENLDGLVDPFRVCLTCYRALEVNGDCRAQGILDTAHRLLQERAGKITDPSLRNSFLENVAVHRELLQAFEHMREAK